MTDSRKLRALMDEVHRYLEAVDAFRTEGYEPHWQPEGGGLARAERRSAPATGVLTSRELRRWLDPG